MMKRLVGTQLVVVFLLIGWMNRVAATAQTDTGTPQNKVTQKVCETDHGSALIEWIRSKGGYVNEKLKLQRMDPTDATSPFGAFASAEMDLDEVIFSIPRSCYMSAASSKEKGDYRVEGADKEEWQELYAQSVCDLAHTILDQWQTYKQNPKDSPYQEFFAYLDTQPKGQIPATYSQAGKDLLRKIVDRPIATISSAATTESQIDMVYYATHPGWHMTDWIDDHFIATGCIPEGDEQARHAVALAIQRGYDAELIPLWDMVNHSNRDLNIKSNSVNAEEGITVWASEVIPKDSEIFATYNFCTDCSDIGTEWGTPGMFRDFGFVEGDYQIWPFLDYGIWFSIEFTEDENGEDGEALLLFDDDESTEEEPYEETFGLPDEAGLLFLQSETQRLKNIRISDYKAKIPLHEFENIERYYSQLVSALEMAIEATYEYMDRDDEGDDEEDA